jgi:hypothetical protein
MIRQQRTLLGFLSDLLLSASLCLLASAPANAQYTITTFAGNGSVNFSGDNVPALQTGINPKALALDSFGNLYLADQAGGRNGGTVRKINSAGIITTVAGGGTQG